MSESKNPAAALQVLKRFLTERGERGDDHVWLPEDTLHRLRQLPAKAGQARAAEPAARMREDPPANRTPTAPANQAPSSKSEPAGGEVGGSTDKASKIAEIRARAEQCNNCRELGSLRETMVFSVGDPDADLMFIGEAPGAEEERQREPFVGPAGQLLTKIIETMGLQRPRVYISNIVKFRPSTGARHQGTANRKPTAEEMAASVTYVQEEVEVVQPKLIVALGGTAMEGLLGLEGGVGRARGQLYDFKGTPAIVTYHPSYLLRSGAISDKRKVWEDMLFAMEQLGMAISDKQRGYFLK